MQTSVLGPEFIAGLVGAVVGGVFALFGAWLHLRHTDRRAAHLVIRRLRNDIASTERSYAFWRKTWNTQHHSGKYYSPRPIQPLGLTGSADADLLLLPKAMRDQMFAINAAIAEFNHTHAPGLVDFVDSVELLEAARSAEMEITDALSALNAAAAKRLREPAATSASARPRLVKK